MKLSTFVASILFLLSPTTRQAPSQAPKGVIEGTVLRSDAEVIEGARVVVARVPLVPAAAAIPSVATDSRGKFILKDLDAGAYRLTAIANGYARQEYGQKVLSAQGTIINLAAGQTLKGIVVRLIATGNVTGRISDENARPAVGVQIQLLRASIV